MNSKLTRISKIVLLFYSLAILLTAFQNCGDINVNSLGPPEPIVTASTKSDPTYLKPPSEKVQISRLVVFMDMSQSMVSQYCDNDISSPEPNPMPACYLSKSADPELWRLINLRRWLVKLQTDLTAVALAETKVLIVPFTGGLAELKRDEPSVDGGSMNFDTVTNAIAYVDRLIAEQTQTKNNIQTADPKVVVESVMGTSIPNTRLELLKAKVKNEVDNLSAAGLSGYANFQVLIFSDGEPVPSIKNIKDAVDRVWAVKEDAFELGGGLFSYNSCRSLCGGVLQSWINNEFSNLPSVLCSDNYGRVRPEACQICLPENSYYCTGGANVPNTSCPAYCVKALDVYNQTGLGSPYDRGFISGASNTLFNDIKTSWGHFESNSPTKIVRSLNGLRAIFAENSEVQFQVHFLKIDKFKLTNPPPPPPTPEVTNWLDLAKTSFTKNATHELITSATMDKTLFKSLQASSSYKIKNFFVFNLNARVDKFGDFQVDSDSDGLYDYEDPNPANSRSNGVCLDSIERSYGCLVLSCNKSLDIDGDNLNECEERTIGSDSYDFDTDNDGLPDGIEILYGANFKKFSVNENSNPQADSISDYKAVFYGVNPLANWDKVSSSKKMDFYYEMTDPKNFPTESGTSIQTWGYVAQIRSFPGYEKLATSVNFPMYVSKNQNTANQHAFNILDSNAAANQNSMLILVSLVSVSNPNEIYWFALNKGVSFEQADPIDLNLSDLIQIRAKDPQGAFQ